MAMDEQKVFQLEAVAILGSLVTQAVVCFDDIDDSLTDSPALQALLDVAPEEFQACEQFLRKLSDRCCQVRRQLRAEVLAVGRGSTSSEAAGPGAGEAASEEPTVTLDGLWESAYQSNPGPYTFESQLLQATPQGASEDTSAEN